MLAGPGAALAELLGGPLFDPEMPVAGAIATVGRLRADGYLPLNRSFRPAPAGPDETAAAPEPSPEERLRLMEEALRLSRDERRKTQQSLAILGFDPRGIDGGRQIRCPSLREQLGEAL